MCVYFWALYSVPLIQMLCVCVCVCAPIPCCFDYSSFAVLSEVWESYASRFVLFPQDYFGIWIFYSSMIFRIFCFHSVKNVMGNLIGIALNLQIVLGSMALFTILIFPQIKTHTKMKRHKRWKHKHNTKEDNQTIKRKTKRKRKKPRRNTKSTGKQGLKWQ